MTTLAYASRAAPKENKKQKPAENTILPFQKPPNPISTPLSYIFIYNINNIIIYAKQINNSRNRVLEFKHSIIHWWLLSSHNFECLTLVLKRFVSSLFRLHKKCFVRKLLFFVIILLNWFIHESFLILQSWFRPSDRMFRRSSSRQRQMAAGRWN